MDTLSDLLGTSSESLRMTEKQQRVIRAAAKRNLNDPATTKAEIAKDANVDPTYIDHVLSRITEDVLDYFRDAPVEGDISELTDNYGISAEEIETEPVTDSRLGGMAWTRGTSFIINRGGVPLLVEVSVPRESLADEVEDRLSALFCD